MHVAVSVSRISEGLSPSLLLALRCDRGVSQLPALALHCSLWLPCRSLKTHKSAAAWAFVTPVCPCAHPTGTSSYLHCKGFMVKKLFVWVQLSSGRPCMFYFYLHYSDATKCV